MEEVINRRKATETCDLTYRSWSQQNWQERRWRGRAETSPEAVSVFCFLCSPAAFLDIVLFPSSKVHLHFQSPTEPEAFLPLAFIDFAWHADVALQKEVLCCSLYQKGERSSVSAAASRLSVRESNSLCFHERFCWVGKWGILLPIVVGYTLQSKWHGETVK